MVEALAEVAVADVAEAAAASRVAASAPRLTTRESRENTESPEFLVAAEGRSDHVQSPESSRAAHRKLLGRLAELC